jgi:predicted cobalt transporter CbtA
VSLSEDELTQIEARATRADLSSDPAVAFAADHEETRALVAEIRRLRAVLAHYADETTWKPNSKWDRFARVYRANHGQHGYDLARAALGAGADRGTE